MGRPSNFTAPPSAGNMPEIMLISVLLPQPFGPKIEMNSPAGRSTSKSRERYAPSNCLVSPRTSMPRRALGAPPAASASGRSTCSVRGIASAMSAARPMDEMALDQQEEVVEAVAERARHEQRAVHVLEVVRV